MLLAYTSVTFLRREQWPKRLWLRGTRKTEIALCKAGATLRQTGAGTLPLRGFPF